MVILKRLVEVRWSAFLVALIVLFLILGVVAFNEASRRPIYLEQGDSWALVNISSAICSVGCFAFASTLVVFGSLRAERRRCRDGIKDPHDS